MNDNTSLAQGSARSGFGGLPQRLVQDGVVDEAAMLEAVNAARERKTSVVTHLVTSGAANARDIAVAASNEFGVPLFDLDARESRSRHRSPGQRQAAGEAPRIAGFPPRQAAVPRGRGPDQSARH